MTGRRAYLRDLGGAAAVEFALASVPLLMTVMAAMGLGRYAWTVQALQAVATDAARCVGLRRAACATSATPSVSLTQSYAVTAAGGWHLTLLPSQVTVTTSTTCGGASAMSLVQIAYTFTGSGGLVPALGSVAVTASACFPNAS